MRCLRNFCISWLIVISSLMPFAAWCAAVPAYTGQINSAVGSVIKFKASKWGFAANDPKIAATTAAVSTAVTTLAGGLAVGALTTISWPALLVGAGVSALVSGALYLGVDGLVNWWYGSGENEGKVQVSGSGMPSGNKADFPVMVTTWPEFLTIYGPGQDVWLQPTSGTTPRHIQTFKSVCNRGEGVTIFCNEAMQSASQPNCTYNSIPYQGVCSAASSPFPGVNGYWASSYRNSAVVTASHIDPVTHVNVIDQTVATMAWDFIAPSTAPLKYPGYTPSWITPKQAIIDTPASQGTVKLSDAQIAALVNAVWKLAQQNAPIPYSSSDPVTPGDVASWRSANPQLAPTVGNLFEPITSVGSDTVPIPLPGEPGSGTTPGGPGQTIDLGPDPGIKAPNLDETPTATSILAPIFNLMPDLRSFVMPAHSSTCPVLVFDMVSFHGGWYWTMNSHCNLVDSNRNLISVAMILIWTLTAAFIILKA
jgi:hypothetical protein